MRESLRRRERELGYGGRRVDGGGGCKGSKVCESVDIKKN